MAAQTAGFWYAQDLEFFDGFGSLTSQGRKAHVGKEDQAYLLFIRQEVAVDQAGLFVHSACVNFLGCGRWRKTLQ